MHNHSINEEGIKRIKEQGCCVGKYRILLDDVYYCYLEDVYNCKNQDKQFIKKYNSHMHICKTNYQKPCEECDLYKKYKI